MNAKQRRAAMMMMNQTAFRLPYSVDFSAGSLGRLTGSTWSIVGGKAVNTPTLGAEMCTNPEFTTNTTGWSVQNGATLTRRDYTTAPDIDPTGGADNFGMEVKCNGSFNAAGSFAPGAAAGSWYQTTVRAFSPSADAGTRVAQLLVTDGLVNTGALQTAAEDVWETLLYTARSTGATPTIRLVVLGNTSGDLGHFDAVSHKQITNMIAYIPRSLPTTAIVKAAWNVVGKTQAGVIGWWDGVSPMQNCLVAFHDKTNAVLLKYIGTTMTQLVSAAAAYGDGRALEIRRTAGTNTFGLYYNNAQVGTDQTLDPVIDAAIINNGYFGLFSTSAVNGCASFNLS